MADMSWMALALALTACGGLWTWYAWNHRGTASAVRGAALTLLPGAAWMTGTLEMFGKMSAAVSNWAVGFVFSPLVWMGIGLFALSVILFGVSARISDPEPEALPDEPAKGRKSRKRKEKKELPPAKGAPAIDDDLADIEAILRKRGIN